VARAQQAEALRKGLTLRADVPESPLVARVDEERINQVITNLVTNAINYTPIGGSVDIRLQTCENNGKVMISVEDSGVGIPPEHLPLIFQPFYRVTNEVEGTGLGLSIAKEIIEQHGGTIEVTSQPGKGSRFDIILTLAQTPAPAA
jgi:signal transduction histidine kinase